MDAADANRSLRVTVSALIALTVGAVAVVVAGASAAGAASRDRAAPIVRIDTGAVRGFTARGIKIFRPDPVTKKQRTIPIDYGQITSGKRLDMNIWILAGDVISVP